LTTTIAVAGKGGTGKTTFATLLCKYIRAHRLGTILAIDADPSANLNLALGMELGETIGRIREDTRTEVSSGRYDASVPKADYFEYQVADSLVEGDDIDLIAMGRPEGPGCYCAANNILRNVIDRLGNQYDYVVIDNEAGMEHISRQTAREVDRLFIVTDLTLRGLAAAGHIAGLIHELGARVHQAYLVVNRTEGDLPAAWLPKIHEYGLTLIGTLPNDPLVSEFDLVGRPIVEIGDEAPIYQAVAAIATQAGIHEESDAQHNRTRRDAC
jgi:CO dehydrogenase maturation factor